MSIAETLREISEESCLALAETDSLRLIAEEVEELEAEIKFFKDQLDPIREWSGGGTEGNRPDIVILTDVVADLEKDRKELLDVKAENKQLKEDKKEMARLLGCLEPDENGKSVCDPPCLSCAALKG